MGEKTEGIRTSDNDFLGVRDESTFRYDDSDR